MVCRSASSWSAGDITMSGCWRSAAGLKAALAKERYDERRRTIECKRGGGPSRGRHTQRRAAGSRLPRPDRRAQRGQGLVWLDRELALAQARARDRDGRPGLLKGVPVGVKDVIDTYDMPTQHGSPIYAGNRPFADAACVALTRIAGGVVLGKTVTTEFANRHPRETVHPHNPAHTPGGSSSGSAAAVADFQVPVAFGTQTGGSTIRPAAFCGVIGYKPSFGEMSRVGIKMQCHNLDTLGIICRSLDDLTLLRAVLLRQPRQAIDRTANAPRIGFCRTPAWDQASAETQALLERTAARLAAAGATVAEVAPAPPDILDQHRRIFEFEAARNYAYEYEAHGEKLSAALRDGLLKPGRALPLAAYIAAIEAAEAFRARLDEVFDECDVL